MQKYIIGIFIGIIIAGSIGVYAAIKYQASEIEYKGQQLDVVLDDLYDKVENGLIDYFNTPTYYESYGTLGFAKTLPLPVYAGEVFDTGSSDATGILYNLTFETY